MKIKTSTVYKYFDSILLMINLFLVIPRVIISIYNKEHSKEFIIALFFGFLAYYFIPNDEMDLFRHYEAYSDFKLSGVNSFYQDFGLMYLFEIFASLNLDSRWLAFSSAFILYYIVMKIHSESTIKIHSGLSCLLIAYFMLFSFPILLTTGLRYSTGLIIFIYALYLIEVKNNKRLGLIFLLLSPLIHFSISILLVIYFLSKIMKNGLILSSTTRLFILIICVGIGITLKYYIGIIEVLINFINTSLVNREMFSSSSYITGEWGLDRGDQLTTVGLIFYNIKRILLAIVIFVHFITYSGSLKKLNNVIFLISCLCLVSIDIGTIYFRFGYACVFFIVIMNVANIKFSRKNSAIMLPLLCYITFTLFVDIFAIRNEIVNSYFNNQSVSYIVELLNG